LSPWRLAARRFARRRAALAGLAVVLLLCGVALAASSIAPADPLAMPDPVGQQLRPPGMDHLMGTDLFSRDVLSRVIYGARVSLGVGMAAALLATLLGGLVGFAAGLGAPWLDGTLMRGVDVLLALPRVFLLLAALALWESVPIWAVTLLIAATGWFDTSRLVRGHVKSLSTSDFAIAARALGAGRFRLSLHLLPHAASTLIVSATLDVGNIILLEAGLSMLGLGIAPPTPSWGSMIREGHDQLFTAPWVALAPGVALVLTVAAFNLLGDGLRDALSPRQAA
jgi:peptide/nickel transport system permease protein